MALPNLKQHCLSFSSIKFIYALNSIFGFYFGFSSSRLFKNFMRLYCIALLLFVFFTHLFFFKITFLTVAFTLCSTFCLFTANKGMISYFKSLEYVTQRMTSKAIPVLPKNLKYGLMMLAAIRFILTLQHTESIRDHPFTFIFVTYKVVSLDVANFTRVVVFYALYNRMMILRSLFKATLAEVAKGDMGMEEQNAKFKEIRNLASVYIEFLNCLELVDGEMQISILISMICGFGGTMQILYDIVNYTYLEGTLTVGNAGSVIEHSFSVMCGFVPAMVVEMAADQARKIERHLKKRLAFCNDAQLHSELQHAANVFSWRPLRVSVCRVVTMTAATPLHFASLCINYTVVMLQFIDSNKPKTSVAHSD